MLVHPPTVVFDIGNVILKHDPTPACERLSKLTHLSPIEVQQSICGSELERQFTRGEIDGRKFTEGVNAKLSLALSQDELKLIWVNAYTESAEVPQIIHELHGRHRLMLLSNINEWHAEHVLSHFDLFGLFDNAVLSYQAGCLKPDDRIFELLLERVDSQNQVVFIDDNRDYVDAACRMGIDGIVYRDPARLRIDLLNLGCSLAD